MICLCVIIVQPPPRRVSALPPGGQDLPVENHCSHWNNNTKCLWNFVLACYIRSHPVHLLGDKPPLSLKPSGTPGLIKWLLSLLRKMVSDSAVMTLVGASFHHWAARTEKSRDFAEQALFALSDGATSRPADVVEWSAHVGTCGATRTLSDPWKPSGLFKSLYILCIL